MSNYKLIYRISVIVIAVLAALMVGAIVILAVGGDVFGTYWIIISMPFRNFRTFCDVLIRMIPLLIVALGISVSSRCGIINIGAEGQMYMGIIAATALATNCQSLPKFILLPLCILAGAVAGGLYGFIPGWLKAKLEVSELLSTVMLNYAAAQFFAFCIRVPLLDPAEKSGTPMSRRILENAKLSRLFPGASLHQGIFIALILVVVIYILMFKTTWGYKMRAAGASSRAARYGGINVPKYLIISMVISGACAGIAGAVELLGVQGRAIGGMTGGYGFSGVVVALFGGLHPLWIIPASFLFGMLLYSQVNLQILTTVPPDLVKMLQGLIILIIVAVQMVISNPYSMERFRKRFFAGRGKQKTLKEA
ncbi:MAG: ABC transporter permease [Spirochaetales bacterium]|nr:ABC transporter permease [Spirochaetales bacterium]MBR6348019.1 ABC transporter permease [Spirochaetales bacterium]